jgi:hypothetical protein
MEAAGQGQVALRYAPALTYASSSGPVQHAHDKGDYNHDKRQSPRARRTNREER